MKKITLILIVLLALGAFAAHAQDDIVRVRLAHLSYDAGELELFVNGSAAFSAGFGTITRYFEGGAGTYQLAVVPEGQGIEAAVLGPADVNFESGHNYTLAAIGQQSDMSFSPLIIDETLAMETAGVTSNSTMLLVNAVSGGSAVDAYAAGEPLTAQLSFGGYVAADAPAGEFEISATAAGAPDTVIFAQNAIGLPNNMLFVAIAGVADDFTMFSSNSSSLNAVEFLSGLSGTLYSSDVLLSLVGDAGLTDSLANQGPFTLFAPLDSAFAATTMPADTDLTSLLGYHIVPEYVSSSDIVDELIESGSVSLTTTQGGNVTISNSEGTVLVNNASQLVGVDYYVRNGVIHFVNGVLIP